MEHEAISIGDWYYIKLIMMSLFIFGDLFVNSKAEFEALEVDKRLLPSYYEATNNDSMGQLQIILFGCNILLQASIFSAFFLILVDTFPFQVGLIGVIWRQFKSMIIGQGCYSAISIIVGTMRLVRVNENQELNHFSVLNTRYFLQRIKSSRATQT